MPEIRDHSAALPKGPHGEPRRWVLDDDEMARLHAEAKAATIAAGVVAGLAFLRTCAAIVTLRRRKREKAG